MKSQIIVIKCLEKADPIHDKFGKESHHVATKAKQGFKIFLGQLRIFFLLITSEKNSILWEDT